MPLIMIELIIYRVIINIPFIGLKFKEWVEGFIIPFDCTTFTRGLTLRLIRK